ncbi:MAG: M14 family zinc carboxypeptidase [Fimbriimonadales bacterium]
MRRIASLLIAGFVSLAFAQNDEGYGKKIKEYTTEPFFLIDLVDHLPASATVPTPEKFLGHIVGAPNVLDTAEQCAEYLRLLEKSSPRVKVVSMGKSEEGREMVAALVSDEANLARLPRLKAINGLLGDPRKIKSEDVDALIAEDVPMYWATGGMHAPETGPPEMIMELAYRLAVSEEPMIKNIRKNEIVMLTPVLDTDGRDRVVDLYRYRKANPTKTPIPLVYWGHYVAHDDNRDGMVDSLALSKAVAKTWMEFKPLVFHDLHESVPYLYISTGTGPYNPSYDPITIDEWHMLAYNEIDELTKRGVPGVWTHNYYDGWSPSYGFMIANGHNGIGRFYETQGGGGADTGIVSSGGSSGRDWYRPNPPFPRVRWSIRDNTNLMESALLVGLNKVATEKDMFLKNYYLKSKRSVAKATTEGPAAYVIRWPRGGEGRLLALAKILQSQGIELQRLEDEVETKEGKFIPGAVVVRMDQPYSRMADMMFDKQFYNPADPRSYDDTGWQLGPLFNLDVVRVTDSAILKTKMSAISGAPGDRKDISIDNAHDLVEGDDFTAIQTVMRNPDVKIEVATRGFDSGDVHFAPGTLLVTGDKFAWPAGANASRVGFDYDKGGFRPVTMPRMAIVHTWTDTQDEGWWRKAFDELGVKYSYVPVQALRDTEDLKGKFDVIILPPGGGSPQAIVNGLPKLGDAISWKASKEYPSLGGPDERDDIRGGIELSGMVHLQAFVEKGGLLICSGQACGIPIQYGLVNGVSLVQPTQLGAPGGVFLTQNAASDSPVMNGYGETLSVYFNQHSCPLLQVTVGGPGRGRRGGPAAGPTTRPSGRGSVTDPDVIQGRPPYTPKSQPGDAPETPRRGPQLPQPRVLLRYSSLDSLLVSGMLDHGDELAGKAALVDCPVGKGHILLFSLNPFWRMETVGSYNLVFNAALNWDKLGAGRPAPSAEH